MDFNFLSLDLWAIANDAFTGKLKLLSYWLYKEQASKWLLKRMKLSLSLGGVCFHPMPECGDIF